MLNKKIRVVVINSAAESVRRNEMLLTMKKLDIREVELIPAVEGKDIRFSPGGEAVLAEGRKYPYGPYKGRLPLRKQYLLRNAAGRCLSHHLAREDQKDGSYTIILEDDAVGMQDKKTWEAYMDHLPDEKDYDIILLSDRVKDDMAYKMGKPYNAYFSHLAEPGFDISGSHAYIVNPNVVGLLGRALHFNLEADEFLTYCINKFKLRVLVANSVLFRQKSHLPVKAVERKYRILIYNKVWGQAMDLSKIPIPEDFELTYDRECLEEADAVCFHMPNMEEDDPLLRTGKKRAEQLWVFWSMECEQHRPWQSDPSVAGLFDITMTYRLDSDVPMPYFYPGYYDWLRTEEKLVHKLRQVFHKKKLINAFISSTWNASGRIEFLQELMSYINVDSYGKVMNNIQMPEDDGRNTKMSVISDYKFTIAFENARAKDYVTEKFYQPLIMGSVPVYLGAPNVSDFAPGDQCYIDATRFASVKELADYLVELDKNDRLYRQYLKWKKLPYREGFLLDEKMIRQRPFVRLCEVVRNKLRNSTVSLSHMAL